MTLENDTNQFVHSKISDAAQQSFYAAEDRLVAPLTA